MTMLAVAAPEAILPTLVDPLAELARDTAQGHQGATTRLLRALGPQIFSVLRALLGHGDPDIDDVAQESMVAIVRGLGAFRYESSVAYFARRVTVQRASVALRHRRAARRSAVATRVEPDLDERVESAAPTPLGAALAAERMAAFRDIVTELPEEQVEALQLRVLLGHSIEEIAEITAAPVNTVRSRLRAAKTTMRERMAQDARLADLREEGER